MSHDGKAEDCELSKRSNRSAPAVIISTLGVTVFISAVLACTAFAGKAASHPTSAARILLGCWNKMFSPEQLESALNPQAPSLRPSFEVCFFKSGKAVTYSVIPREREGINDGFRWRLTGRSRLVIDSNDRCELTLEDDRTITLKGCRLSGRFSRKCSRVDEAVGGCKG